jgi:hypothetical protein
MPKMSLNARNKQKQAETVTPADAAPEVLDAAPEPAPAPAPQSRASAAPAGAMVPFGVLTTGNKALAAVLDGKALPSIDVEAGGNFVTFMHPMSKRWGAAAGAVPGLKTFDPVLFCGEESPRRLTPFRCHFVDGFSYYGSFADEGSLLAAARQKTDRCVTEVVDCLILAHTPDGVRAATFRTKSGTAKIGAVMSSTLKATTLPEWGKLSPAHAETLALPKPFLRAAFEVSATARTAKSTGRQYAAGECHPLASTATDVRALGAYFGDPECMAEFNKVWDGYTRRRVEVDSLIAKSATA